LCEEAYHQSIMALTVVSYIAYVLSITRSLH
jgi:hypothetical protein